MTPNQRTVLQGIGFKAVIHEQAHEDMPYIQLVDGLGRVWWKGEVQAARHDANPTRGRLYDRQPSTAINYLWLKHAPSLPRLDRALRLAFMQTKQYGIEQRLLTEGYYVSLLNIRQNYARVVGASGHATPEIAMLHLYLNATNAGLVFPVDVENL